MKLNRQRAELFKDRPDRFRFHLDQEVPDTEKRAVRLNRRFSQQFVGGQQAFFVVEFKDNSFVRDAVVFDDEVCRSEDESSCGPKTVFRQIEEELPDLITAELDLCEDVLRFVAIEADRGYR